MPDSVPASPDTPPRLTDRRLGRRRLLALAAGAPGAIAIAKVSGGFNAPANSPLPANAATDTLDPHTGTACYFC